MMAREIGCAVFAGLAGIVALLAACGVIRSKNPYAALHALGAANVLFPVLLFIAVFVIGGLSVSSIKAAVLVVVMLVTGPFTSHALALAQKTRAPR